MRSPSEKSWGGIGLGLKMVGRPRGRPEAVEMFHIWILGDLLGSLN